MAFLPYNLIKRIRACPVVDPKYIPVGGLFEHVLDNDRDRGRVWERVMCEARIAYWCKSVTIPRINECIISMNVNVYAIWLDPELETEIRLCAS